MQCVQVLSDIVEKNPDCVFDIEGGEDIFLVAVGIVYEKYNEKIQLHRFNVHTNSLVDCDADGNVCRTSSLQMTVDENVSVYGLSLIHI